MFWSILHLLLAMCAVKHRGYASDHHLEFCESRFRYATRSPSLIWLLSEPVTEVGTRQWTYCVNTDNGRS